MTFGKRLVAFGFPTGGDQAHVPNHRAACIQICRADPKRRPRACSRAISASSSPVTYFSNNLRNGRIEH